MRKKIVAGNWKMNTMPDEGFQLAADVASKRSLAGEGVKIILAPPFTHLREVSNALVGTDISVAAQNCAAEEKGAFTGEVSAAMVAASGAEYVILGHSERRQYYGETSQLIIRKMEQAFACGLTPIFCIGENLDQREAGQHFGVVKRQLEEVVSEIGDELFPKLIIAYEPVWAIGTGRTATAAEAQQMHKHIRDLLKERFGKVAGNTVILYGGSVNGENAAELFSGPDVDGGLVGGASLNAEGFIAITRGFQP